MVKEFKKLDKGLREYVKEFVKTLDIKMRNSPVKFTSIFITSDNLVFTNEGAVNAYIGQKYTRYAMRDPKKLAKFNQDITHAKFSIEEIKKELATKTK